MTACRGVSRELRDSAASKLCLATNWAWPGPGVATSAAHEEQQKKNAHTENVKIIQMVWRVHTIHIRMYVDVSHRKYKMKMKQQREFYTFNIFFLPFRSLLFFFTCSVPQLFMVEINVCGDQTKAKVECDSTCE